MKINLKTTSACGAISGILSTCLTAFFSDWIAVSGWLFPLLLLLSFVLIIYKSKEKPVLRKAFLYVALFIIVFWLTRLLLFYVLLSYFFSHNPTGSY